MLCPGSARARWARESSGITARRAPRNARARRTRVGKTKALRARRPASPSPARPPDGGASVAVAPGTDSPAGEAAGALAGKLSARRATVAVIGMGYVGLPLACEFARAGFSVVGIDVDAAKVEGIRGGRSHVQDVPDTQLGPLVES